MMERWHALDKGKILGKLESGEQGISEEEAKERLKRYGKNRIRELKGPSRINIFLAQFRSVFVIILLFAALFSLAIQHYIDFSVISVIVLLNAFIGFFQQYRAEKTIAEMKSFLVPKAKVLRAGVLEEISSEDLVPGDIIIISEGDKIMADCRVLQSNELGVNETILTAESFPQEKKSNIIKAETILAEQKNMLFMGTTALKGSGRAVVISTGMNTEFGKIAKLVQRVKDPKTPLEEKIDRFSKKIAIAILVVIIFTVFLGLYRGEPVFTMILSGIALAVSVIPEGLPAIIAITLAFAIRRMKKANALIRTLPAAETLGRTTVICVDKTGTLTEEEMMVVKLYAGKNSYDVRNGSFLLDRKAITPLRNKNIRELLKIGILCNNARVEVIDGKVKVIGDPTERAIAAVADKAGLNKKRETEGAIRVKEYSFTSKRKLMSIIRQGDKGLINYVKGAPDIILKKCTKEYRDGEIVPLSKKRKEELGSIHNKMALSSLRVLGFAFKQVSSKFKQESAESELVFVGFQGMLDPPRKEVANAVKECLSAGIKIKMLTGDALLTAEAVSDMIGLDGEGIDAQELERLHGEAFSKAVSQKTIFARINPELKLKIVRELKRQREIVAVTGDGVNDVLALKDAHIGVAMGIRGSDVARETSDIILLDDNFASVVKSVREGRRVYDNLKKSIKFQLAANVDELLVVFIALAVALPLPLLPLAVLWMNLITDSLPALSLSVERAEENVMRRPPRNPQEGVLKGISSFIVIAGILAFIATILVFVMHYETDLDKARTMALSVSVFCELFLVFTCRSEDKNIWKQGFFSNKFVIYAVLIAVALQLTAIYTPLASVFGFVSLSLTELGIVIALSSISFVFFETNKFIKARKRY